jgi:hypothetical protein
MCTEDGGQQVVFEGSGKYYLYHQIVASYFTYTSYQLNLTTLLHLTWLPSLGFSIHLLCLPS